MNAPLSRSPLWDQDIVNCFPSVSVEERVRVVRRSAAHKPMTKDQLIDIIRAMLWVCGLSHDLSLSCEICVLVCGKSKVVLVDAMCRLRCGITSGESGQQRKNYPN